MRRVIACVLSFAIVSSNAFAELLLFDNFEYVVNRDNDPLPGSTNNPFVTVGPWSSVKAVNITGSHVGLLYTTNSIPGYSGPMPGTNSTRVLKMEARNVSGGTDFYLEYGGTANAIPANVWFQWWMYINYHPQSGETSGLESRHKFIYPCDTYYPCSFYNGDMKWLLSLSAVTYNTLCTTGIPDQCAPFGNPTENGEAFIILRDIVGPNYLPAYPDNHNKLGPNLQSVEQAYIVPNQWQLIKVNLDTSVENSGKFQVWIKPLGGEWRKVSEWIAGVTSDFTWTHVAGGHRSFRMPTTIGWTNTSLGGAWYYLDDFAMASTEDSLPVYDGGSPSVLARPANLRTTP